MPNLPQVQVAAFVVKDKQLLMGHRNGEVVIPSGDIAPYESVNEAARFAILENTGIAAVIQDILFVSEMVNQSQQDHRIVLYMLAKYVDGEFSENGDLRDLMWVDTRELNDYGEDMSDETIDSLAKLQMALRLRGMAVVQ